MFKEEERQIRKFREMGYSCYALAKVMTINYGTMKKYCRDHNILPLEELKTTAENRLLKACELCGKVFVRKRDDAKFCSDYCRRKNWVMLQESEENFVNENDPEGETATLPSINTIPEKTPILFKKSLALSLKKSDELVGDNKKKEAR